jgi:hypothetical protein
MLEQELRELQIAWPETPDIAATVSERLTAAPAPPRRRWLLARPAWQIAVAAAALVIAVVMAVPPTRAAVLDFLGFSSVRIERGEVEPSRFGSALALGEPVTLDQARRRSGFDVLVPRAVGDPDAVYLGEQPRRVDLLYRARPGLPRADTTGAGLLVTELQATAAPVIEKALGASARAQRLRVDGDPAYFISGADHGFAYVPADGSDVRFEEQRLAGNTLLVDRRDGILLRVEGDIGREQAVRIAESMR